MRIRDRDEKLVQKNFRKEAANKAVAVMALMAGYACLPLVMGQELMLCQNNTKYPYSRKRMMMNREILGQRAWKLHMPELMYTRRDEEKISFEKWLINQMELLFPIGYMANGEEETDAGGGG